VAGRTVPGTPGWTALHLAISSGPSAIAGFSATLVDAEESGPVKKGEQARHR
jgi:hypothetical protein